MWYDWGVIILCATKRTVCAVTKWWESVRECGVVGRAKSKLRVIAKKCLQTVSVAVAHGYHILYAPAHCVYCDCIVVVVREVGSCWILYKCDSVVGRVQSAIHAHHCNVDARDLSILAVDRAQQLGDDDGRPLAHGGLRNPDTSDNVGERDLQCGSCRDIADGA